MFMGRELPFGMELYPVNPLIPDEPDVKFIRYSAGTSPGNSGGPLLDARGRIVALVFASTQNRKL